VSQLPESAGFDVKPENLFDWNYWLTTWPAQPMVLTRANAADGYPRALTPLSQDLIVRYEDAGVRRFFEETLGAMKPSDAPAPYMWCMWGHVYVNADQLANLGTVMPGSSKQSIYQQYMGLRPDPDFRSPAPSSADRFASLRALGPVAAGMLKAARTAKARFAGEITTIRGLRPASGTADERECLAWLLRLESVTTAAWESLMIGPGIASATFDVCEKVIAKATGRPAGDLTNRLHVGLGGNESAEAGRLVGRLAALARTNPALADALRAGCDAAAAGELDAGFGSELRRGLQRFGHHTAPELELAQPTWRQQPGQLLAMVARELQRPAATEDRGIEVRRGAEAELAGAVRPSMRLVVDKVLTLSRSQMALRENAKVPIVLIFDELRRVLETATPLLVARGALARGSDAVYLRYDELKGVLAGADAPLPAELARRVDQHRRCLTLTMPELVEAGPGYVVPITERHIRERGLLPEITVDEQTTVLTGTAASSGRVTGTARVMDDPLDDFEPGDILIAKTVDPGWSAALSCAGAVVLDIGGGLSHGAVVARELGIPCVVNVKAGTTAIRDGSAVTVDGSTGEVFLESHPVLGSEIGTV
jgi:pyruvate,water dikinase